MHARQTEPQMESQGDLGSGTPAPPHLLTLGSPLHLNESFLIKGHDKNTRPRCVFSPERKACDLTLLKPGGFSRLQQAREEVASDPLAGHTACPLLHPVCTKSSLPGGQGNSAWPHLPQSSQQPRVMCQPRWVKPVGRAWHVLAPARPARRSQRVAPHDAHFPKVAGCLPWVPLDVDLEARTGLELGCGGCGSIRLTGHGGICCPVPNLDHRACRQHRSQARSGRQWGSQRGLGQGERSLIPPLRATREGDRPGGDKPDGRCGTPAHLQTSLGSVAGASQAGPWWGKDSCTAPGAVSSSWLGFWLPAALALGAHGSSETARCCSLAPLSVGAGEWEAWGQRPDES